MPTGEDPRSEVVLAGRALASVGQSDLVWGHVSLRDAAGRGVWMKRSGIGLDEAEPADVLLVGWDGIVLEGDGRRHIEFPIHTEVLAARAEAQAVVHTHPLHCNAFSSLNEPLRPVSHDATLFVPPDVPRFSATRGLVSTAALGAALAETLGASTAVLLVDHGIATTGRSLASAVMAALLLERACRAQLVAMAAGGPTSWTGDEEATAKRENVWSEEQLATGYAYLLRRLG